MKKIFTLFLLMFSLTFFSQTISDPDRPYWYTDVSLATEVSISENKPMLILFTGSDWCIWCIRLQREVFNTTAFTEWSKQNVILVELDFPRDKEQSQELIEQNNLLAQQFKVEGFPTVLFVNANTIEDTTTIIEIEKTGYIPGGPQSWIENANSIINSDK